MKRLLDASGGVISEFHYDEMEDRTYVRRVQDAEPIVENNKALQKEGKGYSASGDLRAIASIPLVVFEEWLRLDGLTYRDYCTRMSRRERSKYRAKKLMEHTAFRTSSGPL